MLRSVVGLAAAAVSMAACATASAPRSLDDDLVVPGQRVGSVTLGMSLADLLKTKGAPTRTLPIEDTGATTYVFDGMTITAHDEVYWIVVMDPRYRTAGGARAGGEQIAARAEMGRPNCVVSADGITIYDYGTYYFDVDNTTGRVRQLGIATATNRCKR